MLFILRHVRQVQYAAVILSLLAATLVYGPGMEGPFVYDDLPNIVLNPSLQQVQLNFTSLREAALSSEAGLLKRPVAMLSFALNALFFQFESFYYKATNLLIHLLVGLGLYWFSVNLLKQHNTISKTSFQPQHVPWVALAACLVWLIHPLNLTSVLYVVQRMNSLAALFTIFGLVGYTEGRKQLIRGSPAGFITILVSISLCGTLAILSKENGLLLPLYAVVIELLFFRLAAADKFKQSFRWFFYLLFILPVIIGAIVLLVKLDSFTSYQYRPFTLGERLLTESRAIWFYLRLILVPDIRQMSYHHDDFALSHGLLDPPSTLAATLGILALAAAAIAVLRRAPIITFGIAWFFVGHSLESTIFPLDPVYEHRNYLPLYGILFALVYYLLHPYQTATNTRKRAFSIGRYGVLLFYLLLLGHGTYLRAATWGNELSLYVFDVRNHPQSKIAHSTLAVLLHKSRQFDRATQHFSIAAGLDTNDPQPLIRLIHHLYIAKGHIPDPLFEELEHRLNGSPFSGITIATFAPLLMDTSKDPDLNGRLVQLYQQYIHQQGSRIPEKSRILAYYNLAKNFRAAAKPREAVVYLQKALESGDDPILYLDLAEVYTELDNNKKAKATLHAMSSKYNDLSPELLKQKKKLIQKIEAGEHTAD